MQLPAQLFHRKPETQKWDYGHVFVLAGSKRYPGCAILCAEAAMRSGAGLVCLGIPASLMPVFASRVKEVTLCPVPHTKEDTLSTEALGDILSLLKKFNVLVMGPGLTQNISTKELVKKIVTQSRVPVVVDADGLNALAGHIGLLKKKQTDLVFTPHLKEMSRLTGLSLETIQRNRKKVAKEFALRYNVTLVLKGHKTIVAAGNGECFVNTTGNPGMATAGSGDVLSGMIAAFIGQGIKPFKAACYAVYLHGLAGDLAAKEKTEISLIASDIVEYLPKAFRRSSSVGRASVL